MFGRNRFSDDDFRDLERQEAYKREKIKRQAGAVGGFLSWFITGGLIWWLTALMIAKTLEHFNYVGGLFELFLIVIAPLLIFKIPYVKENRFKATLLVMFTFSVFIIKIS